MGGRHPVGAPLRRSPHVGRPDRPRLRDHRRDLRVRPRIGGRLANARGVGVCGVGLGLFTVPFFTTALARVAPHETGSAAGLLNAVQQLGATLGTAALGTVFLRGLDAHDPAAVEQAFWIALALTALTAVAARVMTGPDHPIVGTRRVGRRFAPGLSDPSSTVRNHNI